MTRRQLLTLAGLTGLGSAVAALPATPARAVETTSDPVADIYRDALLLHTRWVEEQWDDERGWYSAADFRFASVLGNAVLLGLDDYDESMAAVSEEDLREHTLASIRHYAETNRLAGGDVWGKQLFWDSTFELYLVLAARLLWDELDATTRSRIQAIATGQAAYAYELGAGDDPLYDDRSPNGTLGGWQGDTKLSEMGVYACALAPGLAWGGDAVADSCPDWGDRFLLWMANASGLPVADRNNPALIDGNRVSDLVTAHNLHDTFVVETGDGVNPHYQAELWRAAGRAAVHFLVAGVELPQVLTRQPNGDELWRTLRLLASDAGEAVMPMASDRYHLYGRDVLPLAFLAQVCGDRDAARAEADLAERLLPYLRYDPPYRLTKFGAAVEQEPQARAEIAIAYLLHKLRKRVVQPVSKEEFFAGASGTRDFGAEIGLVVQQTPTAFAGAVTDQGHTTLLWQPGHDNWFVDTRVPAFLPGDTTTTASWSRAWNQERDDVDATATILKTADGVAGYTTLPTGTVVYTSTGLAEEGRLRLFNTFMPGVPGLGGSRSFTFAGGHAALTDQMTGDVKFTPRDARYVRMLGIEPATEHGYSIWSFGVLDADGADLAQGAMPTASSEDVWYPARYATDGNSLTRWAVDRSELTRADSWLAVDLGSAVRVAGVRIGWESAYARKFAVQTSTDAVTWTTVATIPATEETTRWVGIDGRAGLVAHGGKRRISLAPDEVRAEALLIEGYSGATKDLAAAAARKLPTADGLRVSDADGYLSVFNLTGEAATAVPVRLTDAHRLYPGEQRVTRDGLQWLASLPAYRARVKAALFSYSGTAPVGTAFVVHDRASVEVRAPRGSAVTVTLTSGSWSSKVRVSAGKSRTVNVPGRSAPDLALGRTTFPTSPLPDGMTSPASAVDGNPATSWRPGPGGRMVVDLGAETSITERTLTWSAGRRPGYRLEGSADGLSWAELGARARYVAVVVTEWREGDASLVSLVLR